MTLFGCGSGSSGGSPATKPTTPSSLDASSQQDIDQLGKNYTLQLGIKEIESLANNNFNVDITVYNQSLLKTGFFAQVNGVPIRNYKMISDAKVTFELKATTEAGKTYPLNNFELFYEDPNSTSTPEGLAIAVVENKIGNVKPWAKTDEVVLDSTFFNNNDGDKFLKGQRPMNVYVKVGNTLSNGVQIVLMAPQNAGNSYKSVAVDNCGTISASKAPLNANGIAHTSCVSAHGHDIPVLIEAATNDSHAKAQHLMKIFKFYLDFFPKEISDSINESNVAMAFFYDDKWNDDRDVGEYLEENYRFQDLFATETTRIDASENKADLQSPHLKRDAAFEEILHLVHDYGIMANAINSPASKWAVFQTELDLLTAKAILTGNYYPNGKDANLDEVDLDAESYDQEYLAYALYAYYDLNYEGYTAQEMKSATFTELQANDPEMVAFMQKYFPARADFKAEFPGYPNK